MLWATAPTPRANLTSIDFVALAYFDLRFGVDDVDRDVLLPKHEMSLFMARIYESFAYRYTKMKDWHARRWRGSGTISMLGS